MARRVVVTGLGVISSLGDDTRRFWEACLQGRSAVSPIPAHWQAFAPSRCGVWAPLTLPAFDAAFSRAERMQHDPVTLMACTVAADALDAAGLRTRTADRRANTLAIDGVDPLRFGVFVGTGIGGARTFLTSHLHQVLDAPRRRLEALREHAAGAPPAQALAEVLGLMPSPPRFNPFAVSMLMPNAPAAYVGIKFGLRGANESCVEACASGTVAVGRAWQAIAGGRVDHALAGGSEYLDDPHGSIFQGFDVCRALVRDWDPPAMANRPFDVSRSGFLFAQGGAAMLLLESAEHAARRGAPALAEVTGFAESFDAHGMMSPEPGGVAMESMLRDLLRAAGLGPEDIDYINTHGTGTQHNDACEAAVIERVFARRAALNSTKSLLGHTLGASGAIEAVVTALSLRDQRLHPTLNIVDPIADLDFVTASRSQPLRHAVSQSFAFGGHNAAVLMSAVPRDGG